MIIIFYLISNITYKSFNGLAPVYINKLLYHYTPCRSLRSSDSNFLATTITYGDRSFAAIAPKLWNQQPLAIRQSDSVDSFKRAMKTYLFRESSFFLASRHFICRMRFLRTLIIITIMAVVHIWMPD